MTQAKPIPLRKQQKNYTRQRLLQVSRELFVKHGTHGTGIDDIARAAGTSRATVYTHFAGKSEIIRKLLADMWDRALERAEAFDALPDASPASVQGGLQEVLAGWDNYADSTKVVLREMPADAQAECQTRIEAQAAALVATRRKWMHFTEDEARRRAFLLLQQLHRSLLAWYYGGWQQDREALIATLTEIWCATLQPQR